ncbi:MAG: protein kinase [Myxococcales bacterium]|nr:protein kinase [Myxococcales bacterium]
MDDRDPPLWSEVTLRPDSAGAPTARSGEPDVPVGDMPGLIGRFRVDAELGAGGMGVVYAAYDPELDRRVAIKLMYAEPDDARARRSQALLLREAQALAKISHPNIVAIHDIGVYAGQVFVAMEYVSGRTLRRWRDDTPRGWQDIVAVFVQAGRGLVAAHAVGLVHRDVKPDNILVGDDGRVRVADFGVARYNAPDELDAVTEQSGVRPLATVAGRGALIGTLPYMAPEQHVNDGVGPHSDQYSFCVALYEALHGMRPFHGDSPAALVAQIRIGDPLRSPAPHKHPAWLEEAVLRGLSARPEDRWPSMQALLDVLTLEREAQRARRWRRALLAALAISGAVALLLGGRAYQAYRARALAEQAAAERLKVVAAGIDRLLAAGRRAEAEDALRAFVGEPEHRASRAAVDAWLLWADRMAAAGDRKATLTAVVEAYTGLAERDPREPAIFLRIAELFRERWQFHELATLARHAGERWPQAVATPTWSGLRADAAAALRDVDGLLAEVDGGDAGPDHEATAPLLRALNAVTLADAEGYGAYPLDLEGDGRMELAVGAIRGADQSIVLHRMDAGLTPIGPLGTRHSLDGSQLNRWPLTRGPGEPAHLVGHRDGVATLYEVAVDDLKPVLAWEDDMPTATAAADLDGDGRREFYVGTGSYTRKLHRITRDEAGAWHRAPALNAIDAVHSDINALAAGDFDGDGRDELAVALGPWRAYEVRVLEAASHGGLQVGARWRLGHVHGLTALRAADGGTLLAITKDNAAASKTAFPPSKPHGEPPGLYVVRRFGDELKPVYHAPLPVPAGAAGIGHVRWLGAGDLDGDGLDDIIARYEMPPGEFASCLLWRQLADGGFAPARLGHVVPEVVGDFDGDPAAELLVDLRDADGSRFAVLGAGGPPLTAAPASRVTAAPSAVADPVLARAWARAEDLVGFGLYSAAAEALERRIPLAQTEADGRAVQRRAAELHSAAGEPARAAAGYEALAHDGDLAAALAAMASYEQALRLGDALRIAHKLLARDDLPPGARADCERAVDRLAPAVERRDAVELRFDRPLDHAWHVERPSLLHLDRVRGALTVDAFADSGDLMTLPIELSGGPLIVEFELEVERAEWAAQLDVTVRREATGDLFELGVAAGGGGGYLRRYSIFTSPESYGRHEFGPRATDSPRATTRHVLAARLLPEQRMIDIEERGDHPERRSFPLEQQLSPGPATLALRSTDSPGMGAQHLRAHVRRISIAGARLAPPAGSTAHDAVARLMVANRWHEAMAALTPEHDPLWRVLVAHELGRSTEAAAALATVSPDDPRHRLRLRQHLRARPVEILPLLRAAYGPRYAALVREALATATHMHLDAELQQIWLRVGADIESLPAETPDDLDTKAALLTMRGQAWQALGDLDEAAADLDAAAALRTAAAAERDDPLADLELRRAEIAATRGRLDDALAAAERALARATSPSFMAERLRLAAALAGVQQDPRWRRLLAAHAGD